MRRALAITSVALVAAAGCGDEDGPSKADFVEKAGAVCERNKDRASRAFDREFGGRQPRPADGARVLAVTLPHIRATGVQIARLERPEDDREEIDAYLAAYRKAITEMESIAKDPGRARSLMTGKLDDPFAKPDAMAGAYGIEKCSGDEE